MPKPKQQWKNKSRIRRAMMKAKLWFWIDADFKKEIRKSMQKYFLTGEI